jgi:hypothetical protein
MRRLYFGASSKENEDATSRSDITLLLAVMMIFVVSSIIRFVHDASSEDPNKSAFEEIVEWDGKSAVDIDTWTWCVNPATGLWEIVSYQARKGKYLVLNHDDRGFRANRPSDNKNKESVSALGARLPHALCGVNIHVFGLNGGKLPINGGITATVILHKGSMRQVKLLNEKRIDVQKFGEEITVVSFEIDINGNFVVGSNETTVHMRCAKSVKSGQCVLSGL